MQLLDGLFGLAELLREGLLLVMEKGYLGLILLFAGVELLSHGL